MKKITKNFTIGTGIAAILLVVLLRLDWKISAISLLIFELEPPETTAFGAPSLPQATPIMCPGSTKYYTLMLNSIANDNLGTYRNPPTGNTCLGEAKIPFLVSVSFGTQGEYFSDRPTSSTLKITPPVSEVDKVYILINSGATYNHFRNLQVGTIDLNFSDGSSHSTKLIVGQNIREWKISHEGVVNTTSSPDIEEVFRDTNDTGLAVAVLDMLTITVPDEQKYYDLTGITFKDSSKETVGSLDPGYFVAGVTVKQE